MAPFCVKGKWYVWLYPLDQRSFYCPSLVESNRNSPEEGIKGGTEKRINLAWVLRVVYCETLIIGLERGKQLDNEWTGMQMKLPRVNWSFVSFGARKRGEEAGEKRWKMERKQRGRDKIV